MHLCTCVSEEGGDGEAACSEKSFLCTCVNEEGGDGEAACSETPSLLSYTLRYASFAEVGSVCRVYEYRCDERLKTEAEESIYMPHLH
jgi:hypothetical protein